MEIILNGKAATERSVIAMGMFDGVHIGHRVLLERAAVLARRERCPLVVCTFQKHPMELLNPDNTPELLTSFQERITIIEELGADILFALPFDAEIANMLPEEYIGQLVRRFHPVAMVCGYNHHFGKGGAGSPALLEVLGGALGFATSVVPKITLEGETVSSSGIRKRLEEGDVFSACRMLGRPYCRKIRLASDGRFSLTEEDKQGVLDGVYRGRLTTEERQYPVVFGQKGETGYLKTSIAREFSGEAMLEYISQQK